MVSTRAGTDSSPASTKTSPQNGAGTKRKADAGASPVSKRGKKGMAKEQKTLEETMPDDSNDQEVKTGDKFKDDGVKDAEMQEADAEVEESTKATGNDATEPDKADPDKSDKKEPTDDKKAAKPEEPKESKNDADADKDTTECAAQETKGAIEKSPEKKLPSNVIEKGIIYFFTRSRVGIDNPDNVQDLQRSFMVLRPLPEDAKLGDGPIQDLKNNRLIAIPKKVLPKSGNDKFMVFVEKGKTTIQDLKDSFFQGSEYETQTVGTRVIPPVTPVGEGVYTIISQGRSAHLAYLLTIPEKLDEVQKDMGLSNKGSFAISLKNPQRKGPANASLPQAPDFPQDILNEFRGLAWMPVSRSDHLDYPNAQFLLIGEGEEGFEKATEGTNKDEKSNTETPAEEMQELENEDELRVEHLHGDNTVFDDLGISSKDYPKIKTTW